MTTLGEMKASIAAEIMRDDLTDAIAKEIDRAIKFYRTKRFWFTEKQTSVTLTTTDGQSVYGQPPAGLQDNLQLASAYLPDVVRIDSLTTVDTGTVRDIAPISEFDIKRLTGEDAHSGMPRYYSYYGGFLTLWPIPDATYTLLIAGLIRIGAPASDGEEGNVWMTEAEELIRARAKRNLFLNWMEDEQSAARMKALEDEALQSLREEGSQRSQVSRLIPCDL